MANEKYFPFRSVSGDRKYSAEDWAEYFALFLSNGVYYSSADKLKVAEYDGMKVKVQKGAGFIGGRMYLLETDKVLTLDTADGVLSRIDRIVLRCDYANRLISAEVVKGSYSEVPTAPELTRDADVYELALADVYVAAGVITITKANITDQRLNSSLCGIVTGLIDQADTQEIFSQFQAYLQEFKQASKTEYTVVLNEFKNDFTEWFAGVKGTLAEDVAGNLYNKVEDVEDRLENQIATTTTWDMPGSFAGGLKVNSISGNTQQNGTPTPDAPVEIKSVRIKEVKTCGKNLLNLTSGTSGKDGGVQVTVNGDGTYSYVGTATNSNINVWLLGSYAGTEPVLTLQAGTYYIKGVNLYYNRGNVFLTGREGGVVTFTKDTPISGIRSVGATAGTTYNEIIYPIIALSDVEIPYEPYQENVITLSNTVTLNGNDDVKDRIINKGGLWQIERHFRKYVVDAAIINKLAMTSSGTDNFCLVNGLLKDVAKYDRSNGNVKNYISSNYFTGYSQFDMQNAVYDYGICLSTSGSVYFRIKGYSLAQYKEYFNTHSVVFMCELDEVSYEVLPVADQAALDSLRTFDGTTHIITDSEVAAAISVDYGTSKVGAVALLAYLSDCEVVDNLLSNSANLPLSARQGKVLNEKLDNCLYIVSFDASTGTLITKSADYKG